MKIKMMSTQSVMEMMKTVVTMMKKIGLKKMMKMTMIKRGMMEMNHGWLINAQSLMDLFLAKIEIFRIIYF
jgi:hypothetical protein